jgi:hypothetical protein
MPWVVIEDQTGRETVRVLFRYPWIKWSMRVANRLGHEHGWSTYSLRRVP